MGMRNLKLFKIHEFLSSIEYNKWFHFISVLTLYPSLSLCVSVVTELSIAAEDFLLAMLGRPRILGLLTLADMIWSEDLDTLDVTEVDTLLGLRSLLRTAVKGELVLMIWS